MSKRLPHAPCNQSAGNSGDREGIPGMQDMAVSNRLTIGSDNAMRRSQSDRGWTLPANSNSQCSGWMPADCSRISACSLEPSRLRPALSNTAPCSPLGKISFMEVCLSSGEKGVRRNSGGISAPPSVFPRQSDSDGIEARVDCKACTDGLVVAEPTCAQRDVLER